MRQSGHYALMRGWAIAAVVAVAFCAACSSSSGNESGSTTTLSPNIVVPSVIGKTACQALPVLVSSGLVPNATPSAQIYSHVTDQSPTGGAQVPRGSAISLSLGPPTHDTKGCSAPRPGLVMECGPGERKVTSGRVTTCLPRKRRAERPTLMTTSWHQLDKSSDPWSAALAAIRSASTPDQAAQRVLPILRGARQAPSERVTAKVVDARAADEALILIAWRGFADDSVTGVDVRIRATAGTNGVVIFDTKTRSICKRGIGPNRTACV
jgi:PASTA domain